MRLGEGAATALSPDGLWAVVQLGHEKRSLTLYPTGAGEKRVLPIGDLETQGGATFTLDGKSLVFTANEPGHGSRIFLIELAGGKPRALTPEGYRGFGRGMSPDGKSVLAVGPDRKRYLYPLSGGEPTEIRGLSEDDTPNGWASDSHHLYVFRRRDIPARLYRFDIETGTRELVRELMPADGAGIVDISPVMATRDGASYVYGFQRTLSDLYLVEGLK